MWEFPQCYSNEMGRLGLWYVTSLSTLFQLYRGGQFNWWRKPEVHGENQQPVTGR
jgi:hypothetical protein